jgi:hypothetical protein
MFLGLATCLCQMENGRLGIRPRPALDGCCRNGPAFFMRITRVLARLEASRFSAFSDFGIIVGEMFRAVLNVAVSAAIYFTAVAVLVYSESIMRPSGGGPGVPGAILQPLGCFVARSITIVGGVVFVVFAVVAIVNKRKEEGCALYGIGTVVLVTNLAQLAFNVFGPDM